MICWQLAVRPYLTPVWWGTLLCLQHTSSGIIHMKATKCRLPWQLCQALQAHKTYRAHLLTPPQRNKNDRISKQHLQSSCSFSMWPCFHLLNAVAETRCDNAALCREVSLLQRSNIVQQLNMLHTTQQVSTGILIKCCSMLLRCP